MDSDPDVPQETDSSGEGEDDDLSQLGAEQTIVKSFTVRQESYQFLEKGSERQKLTDTVLRSCQPVVQSFVPTSGFPGSDEKQQLVPESSTNKRTKSRIDEWTKGMVKTSAVMKLINKLTRGATWVTIKGCPGEGKTTAAYMALEELYRSERQVFQVLSPEEFSEVTATCRKPVIMLDDVFGNLEFDQTKWLKWEPVLYQVLGGTEHRSHEKETGTSKKIDVTVVLVGRDYVYNSASSDMGRISDYFTLDEHVVYLSPTGERDIQEKLAIWNTISEASGIELDEKTIDTICEIHVPHGFPHVCRLFVTMRKENPNINAERFFKAPLEFLNQTVQKFMKDKVKLALFKDMIKRNGCINIRDLGNVGNAEIIDVANNLVGTYLRKEDGYFTFNHPSIYDSVAFNLSFLHERLRLEPSSGTHHDTSGSESSLVVNIPRCFIVDLAKRFAAEIENRNLRLVLSHKALTDQMVIEKLICCVKLPLTQLMVLTDKQIDEDKQTNERLSPSAVIIANAQEPVLVLERHNNFLSLVATNKSPQLLKYIDIQTDIQLTERDIDIIFYGVCKSAASDVLTYLVQTRDTLDINVRYEDDLTPLMIASGTRDSQFVQQVMSLGPDLNARDSWNQTVLDYLCKNGLVTASEQVIDSGADFNVKDWYGYTPLRSACLHHQVDVIRLLLNKGAILDAKIVVNACREGNLDVIKLLFDRGATVNMRAYWDTPLTSASQGGHVKVMRLLIAKGASVNKVDGSCQSPLLEACFSNKPQAVQCLLEHGADINSRGREGSTSLHTAAELGYRECANMLLKAGAIADSTDKQRQTPLHKSVYCIRYGDPYLPDTSVCEKLIRHGALVNKQDIRGNTPLHLLCQVDCDTEIDWPRQPASVYMIEFRKLVTLLIDHGADREIKNNTGVPALHGWCKTLILQDEV